jgi:hypothetical protein
MKIITLLALILITSACTVEVAAPNKPITIYLNVKIEHEVRIKVEKELEDLFSENSDLFLNFHLTNNETQSKTHKNIRKQGYLMTLKSLFRNDPKR